MKSTREICVFRQSPPIATLRQGTQTTHTNLDPMSLSPERCGEITNTEIIFSPSCCREGRSVQLST